MTSFARRCMVLVRHQPCQKLTRRRLPCCEGTTLQLVADRVLARHGLAMRAGRGLRSMPFLQSPMLGDAANSVRQLQWSAAAQRQAGGQTTVLAASSGPLIALGHRW